MESIKVLIDMIKDLKPVLHLLFHTPGGIVYSSICICIYLYAIGQYWKILATKCIEHIYILPTIIPFLLSHVVFLLFCFFPILNIYILKEAIKVDKLFKKYKKQIDEYIKKHDAEIPEKLKKFKEHLKNGGEPFEPFHY